MVNRFPMALPHSYEMKYRVSIYVSVQFRFTLIKHIHNTELDFTIYLTYAGNSTKWPFYPLNDLGITPYGAKVQ